MATACLASLLRCGLRADLHPVVRVQVGAQGADRPRLRTVREPRAVLVEHVEQFRKRSATFQRRG